MAFVRILLVISALLAASGTQAAGVGVRAGTTGIGGDIGFGLVPTLSARVGYSYLSFSTTVDSSDVKYDAKPVLSNGNLFLDWSPLGPFRITGGVILNTNKVDVTAVPSGGTYTLGGVTYPASAIASLSGTVKVGQLGRAVSRHRLRQCGRRWRQFLFRSRCDVPGQSEGDADSDLRCVGAGCALQPAPSKRRGRGCRPAGQHEELQVFSSREHRRDDRFLAAIASACMVNSRPCARSSVG